MIRTSIVWVLMLFLVAETNAQADVESIFNQAENLIGSGEYKQASALYTKVIAQDPENLNAYLRRGFCHSVMKEYDAAIADFGVVIDKHGRDPYSFISRGSAYNKLEKYETAMVDFDKALGLDPENQEAYNNRGWAKNGLGLYKEACEDWKTSKKLGNEEAKIILKNNHCK